MMLKMEILFIVKNTVTSHTQTSKTCFGNKEAIVNMYLLFWKVLIMWIVVQQKRVREVMKKVSYSVMIENLLSK